MKKRNMILYICLTVILISLAFSLTYAYLTASVKGNDTSEQMNVSASTLKIDFTTSEYINNTRMMLISDTDKADKAEKTIFTIANTSGISAKYNLALTELTISDNLKSSYFKWELLKNDSVVSSGDFTGAVTGTDFNLGTVQSISNNQTDSYVFRTWLSESGTNQLDLLNGSFSAKIKMVATATTE